MFDNLDEFKGLTVPTPEFRKWMELWGFTIRRDWPDELPTIHLVILPGLELVVRVEWVRRIHKFQDVDGQRSPDAFIPSRRLRSSTHVVVREIGFTGVRFVEAEPAALSAFAEEVLSHLSDGWETWSELSTTEASMLRGKIALIEAQEQERYVNRCDPASKAAHDARWARYQMLQQLRREAHEASRLRYNRSIRR